MDRPHESVSLALFRREALAGSRPADSGTPLGMMPMSWRVLIGVQLTAFVLMLSFICTQTISRRETAPGILALTLGEIRIIAPRAGILTNIYVHDGDEVVAGQRLVYVSTSQFLMSGGGMEAGVLQAISAERAALSAQLAELDRSAPTEHFGQQSHLNAELLKLAELRDLLPTKIARLRAAQEAYSDGARFAKLGVVSGDSLRERDYDWLSQRAEVQTIRGEIADLEGQIARDRATLQELPYQQARDRDDVVSKIAALDQKHLDTTGQEGYLIAAKVAGRITALQGKVGQYVDAMRPLMTLTPRGSSLRAELYVPSKAIAFARRGQRVRLMYDAFPYQQFGIAYGTVEQISATVLKPDEIGAAVLLKEPAYLVTVIPDRTSVDAYGTAVPLRAGMALAGDLVIEDRPIYELLLDPLLAARGRILGSEADGAP